MHNSTRVILAYLSATTVATGNGSSLARRSSLVHYRRRSLRIDIGARGSSIRTGRRGQTTIRILSLNVRVNGSHTLRLARVLCGRRGVVGAIVIWGRRIGRRRVLEGINQSASQFNNFLVSSFGVRSAEGAIQLWFQLRHFFSGRSVVS